MSLAPDESRAATLARLRPWVERAHGFSGWSFDDLGERVLDDDKPWSYRALVRERAAGTSAVLDLGTGGGERLAELRSALPSRVVATEEWHVNAPVAAGRLTPLGVDVVRARTAALPFADATFDLVIDRHEELTPAEVVRVLRAGGWAVTQQVGMHHWQEARARFRRWTDFGDHRTRYADEFRALGCDVETREHHRRVAYPSLGAFVYMLTTAPWYLPDFDIEADLDALLAIERACTTRDGLVLTDCRYLLTAHVPSAAADVAANGG